MDGVESFEADDDDVDDVIKEEENEKGEGKVGVGVECEVPRKEMQALAGEKRIIRTI